MRLICRSIHTAIEVGTGSGLTIRQGGTGTLLSHDKMRSLNVMAAILDDMGDKRYRFVAWDMPQLDNDFVIVEYEADRLDQVAIRLMPPVKDMVSLAIAGDCRKELADLYEVYKKLELFRLPELDEADKLLNGTLKPLIAAVAASIKDKTR